MKILKIGFVGGPQSGKTSLIEYLRNYLKVDYHVIIAEEAPTVCLRAGLNPPYNITSLDFQKECLKEYRRIYERLDEYLSNYSINKPVIILFDTLPQIGCTYLKNNDNKSYRIWKEYLDAFLESELSKKYQPDKVYNLELLQSAYSPEGNAVRRVLDTNKVISISEKIDDIFPEAETLCNYLSLEERASTVIDYIDEYFTEPSKIDISNINISTYLHCYNCGWSDTVKIEKMYRYCPMCGKLLASFNPYRPYPSGPVNPYDPNRVTYSDHTTYNGHMSSTNYPLF